MDNQKKQYTVLESQNNARLDVFLALQLDITRSKVQKLIKLAFVKVNNVTAKKTGVALQTGDKVVVEEQLIKENKEKKTEETYVDYNTINILEETEDYLVINKPAGLLVHQTEALEKYTLTNWLCKRNPGITSVGEDSLRPGIVHRLDKPASGVMVIAKNQQMFLHLKKQFQERSIKKEYTVLVHGVVEQEYGQIDFEIARGKEGKMVSRPKTNELSLKNIAKVQKGKDALTEFSVEKTFSRFTLLNVKIHSGRTHQIRVHMLAYNHPVVGDTLYYNKRNNKKHDIDLGRLFLHASSLCFTTLAGKEVCFSASLPDDLQQHISQLV
tara:strand:+ start:154 stop:1131 length:978 start_codon:yes stop_codon:yes gene_type:complete